MPACSTQWQTGERGLQAGPRERGCAGFQRRATPLVGSWGEALRRYGRSPSAKLCPLQGRVPSNARYNPLYLAIRLLKRTDTSRVSISALLSQKRNLDSGKPKLWKKPTALPLATSLVARPFLQKERTPSLDIFHLNEPLI